MILLDVPYMTQVDNSTRYHGQGYRQCNLTSQAMLLLYVQKKFNHEPNLIEQSVQNGMFEPESYYGKKLYERGLAEQGKPYDTTDNNAHTVCLREDFGLETEFCTSASLDMVRTIINHGYPVAAGVLYKTSGHWLAIVGYDDDEFIVNDPYGKRHGDRDYYLEIGGNAGKCDVYRYDTMAKIWGGANGGWIRIPRSFQGQELTTGV